MSKLSLSDLIKSTLAEKSIKDNAEISSMLRNYLDKLDKGSTENIISVKLNSSISLYLLQHQFKAPKELLALNKAIEKGANSYQGYSAITNWIS